MLFVVLNNGGYRVMDRLAEMQGERAAWPAFDTIDLSALARALGLRRAPGRASTPSCWRRSTRRCPGWRGGRRRCCSR